jgi:isoquinoline 1-oxidoreductase beta subunit
MVTASCHLGGKAASDRVSRAIYTNIKAAIRAGFDQRYDMFSLTVNGKVFSLSADPDVPLLWVLRDTLGLRGTKYGCGVGICGSCTVLVDGQPRRACVVAAATLAGREITTIEGLAQTPEHPLLQAWIAEQVPQCGYCQPGQILTATALLASQPKPSETAIKAAMGGVLCRCGTYQRIRRAIQRAGGIAPSPASVEQSLSSGPSIAPGRSRPSAETLALNAWVRIGRDDTVTVLIDRSEMGQGVVTSLAMLVAEELAVDLDQVHTEFAPAAPAYVNPRFGEQVTGGSTSVRAAWQPLREAGAAARERLIAAAAATWGVANSECRAERGAVLHPASGRQLRYGALAEKAATLPVPANVPLTPPTAFRLLGKPLPRLEIPDMVAGRTVYGMDIVLPGLRYASVLRCPVFGGKLARFEARPALAVKGVQQVIAIASGVAVVADSFAAALKGRDALVVGWDTGPNAALTSAAIRRRFARAARRRGKVVRRQGDALRALRRAAQVIEAVYETPYLAHATLEPMNCTAQVRPDGCDVWVPTQAQQGAHETAVRLTGLPEHAVRIHTTFLGGGFGRRLQQDFVAEAVALAKAIAAPVQVVWTRQDDLQHDFYRPAHYTVLKTALDAHGRPVAWFQRIVGPELALEGTDLPYAIPHVREEQVMEDPGIPTGPWRSVGASQNAFAIESFSDELALAAGQDPFAFRRALLTEAPRYRQVLELAAEKANWGTPLTPGQGRGIALYRSFGSWVAEVAKVAVTAEGMIQVQQVVCAIDCGTTVNPDTVVAQMEGAVAFGLSAALKEEIRIAHGGVQQANFEDYPLLTLAEMPTVEVHILPSREPPGGVGEPGVPPVAPAVANAVFAATGQRLRCLPLRLERKQSGG